MPVFPVMCCLRSFGDLGKTCIIDLYAGEDALVMGEAVPLPANKFDRVTLSPMEVWFSTCGVTTDRDITAGLVSWNTEGDILDQYETFNGMPVSCGGDLYDSEDSEWDDPYAISGETYVEDYNFDVPEGMELMVYRHRRAPHSSDIRQNWQMDMTPVCRTMPGDTWDERDKFDDDSLMEAVAADGQDMNEFHQRVVSSDEEDCCDSDVVDLEGLHYLGRNCIMDFSAGGTLSPSKSDLTGPNDPYVTDGPVGQIGTLSPLTSSSEILVGDTNLITDIYKFNNM